MTSSRDPISISARIVVVSTAASILLLGSFGLFLDGLFTRYQRQQYMTLLVSRIEFIHAEIESARDPEDPESEELREIHDVLENQNGHQRADHFYVRVLDEGGRELMTMDGLASIVGSGARFPDAVDDLQDLAVVHHRGASGEHVILTATRLATPRGDRIVHAALDWSVEEELLGAFRVASALALLIGAVVSAFAASTIARRALKPVRELALAADRIEASRLDEPLDVRKAPRELRDLTVSLASMQHRLDVSFSRLSAFAGDLAHELRTPLHNLMGEISVSLSRPRSEEEYRDVLGSALEECGRLARTIDSLLFLARADRGAVELRATEFEVATEIESLLDFYRLYAEERGIVLSLDGSARVVADRELVRQAVGNLLANAAHYSREGGVVATTIRDESGLVSIEVCDDGPGISPEEAARAFDRFFRGGKARKTHPDGSGLGLSIVRSIAVLHGGEASLAVGPNGGTLARLTLPAGGRDQVANSLADYKALISPS